MEQWYDRLDRKEMRGNHICHIIYLCEATLHANPRHLTLQDSKDELHACQQEAAEKREMVKGLQGEEVLKGDEVKDATERHA